MIADLLAVEVMANPMRRVPKEKEKKTRQSLGSFEMPETIRALVVARFVADAAANLETEPEAQIQSHAP